MRTNQFFVLTNWTDVHADESDAHALLSDSSDEYTDFTSVQERLTQINTLI